MFLLYTAILILATLLLYVFLFLKKCFNYFDQHGIPYIKPHWVYGNMRDVVLLKKPVWMGFKEMYDKLEPHKFAGVYFMHKPYILIRDPELIKMILVKDFSYFKDNEFASKNLTEPLLKDLFHSTGDEWKILRTKLSSAFSSSKMKSMFPLMITCAQGIKSTLIDDSSYNHDFDVKDFCGRFTTDVIGSCAFGIDTHSLQNPDSEFRKMGKAIFKFRWQITMRRFLPKHIPSWFNKIMDLGSFPEEVGNYFTRIVRDMVKYREENNVIRGDFLDILIAMKNHDEIETLKTSRNDTEMTVERIAAQCFSFFLAGYEGAVNGIALTLFELAQNLKIQDKLRDEILSTLKENQGEFSYDMMKQMPYMEMVISETLRLYSLGGTLSRKCTENYKIPESDVIIRKDTLLVIPFKALHFDRKYYEKPNSYYPEHFTAEAKLKRHHFAYLPFGEGPRTCIAERFAKMQIFVGLVYMLKDFHFELSPKTKTPLEILPTSTGGVNVKGGIWLNCQLIES